MFCALNSSQRIRPRTPLSTHTPTTSLPRPHSLSEALRFHFSLVYPLNQYSTSAFTIVFEASIHFVESPRLSMTIFSVPVRQYKPSGLLPGYILCRRASQNCRCPRSAWLLFSSIMSARSFEFSQLSLCTLFLEQIHH